MAKFDSSPGKAESPDPAQPADAEPREEHRQPEARATGSAQG